MLLSAEPPPSMDKPSGVNPDHLARSRTTPRKERERGATGPHRQKASKVGRLPEATTRKKEARQTPEVKPNQDTDVKLKTTVVDIDSVRDDEVKEDNLGLLEAADQDDGEFYLGLFSVFIFSLLHRFHRVKGENVLYAKHCEFLQG